MARKRAPVGSGSMAADMAEVFAAKARDIAGKWSTRIPAATHVVDKGDGTAQVVTENSMAPEAYPFEYGIRHPLNYYAQVHSKTTILPKRNMGRTPKRPFMSKAGNDVPTIEAALGVGADRTIKDEWENKEF